LFKLILILVFVSAFFSDTISLRIKLGKEVGGLSRWLEFVNMIRISDDIKTAVVFIHIFHEGWQELTFIVQNALYGFTIVIIQADFPT
jgi:hypothetical protein